VKRARPARQVQGFSLVEVSVAIGIFAFVAIGILGLLPAALRLRADSAQETRAVMIAEEIFASIAASGTLTNVVLRDGPAGQPRNNQSVDLTKDKILLGYPPQTTVPFGLWHSKRGSDPQQVWETGKLDSWAVDNDIQTLALLWATNTGSGLYQVICEIRSPATIPLTNSTPTAFTTFSGAQ